MDLLFVTTFAAGALLEIAVPLAPGYWNVKRFGVSWRVFLPGALFSSSPCRSSTSRSSS